MRLKSQTLAVALVISTLTPPLGAADALQRPAAISPRAGETLSVVLKEWRIQVDKKAVKSGAVTFHVNNHGSERHEVVIIKTHHPHQALPVRHGKVQEAATGELIGEIEEFPRGEARKATFTLTPGDYVLICNVAEKETNGHIESHYQQGMHVAFKVLK